MMRSYRHGLPAPWRAMLSSNRRAVMSKPPLRRIVASQPLAAASYRLTADTGDTFIAVSDGDEPGWRGYHEGDNPDQPLLAHDDGHFTREDCIDSLRAYLDASPRQQPGLRVRDVRRVTSA